MVNHPLLAKVRKKSRDERLSLLDFIRASKSCGSPKNKITVVFDGFVPVGFKDDSGSVQVVFSGERSADEKIKSMVEKSANIGTVVVVSDDKEVKFHARHSKARAMGIEEFLDTAYIRAYGLCVKAKRKAGKTDLKPELTYTQIAQINKELKDLWLK